MFGGSNFDSGRRNCERRRAFEFDRQPHDLLFASGNCLREEALAATDLRDIPLGQLLGLEQVPNTEQVREHVLTPLYCAVVRI
ncbi:MAG: hypothetical protein E5X69_24935, partial [Mesorhizobium sp.]